MTTQRDYKKPEDGMMVFHGYDDSLKYIFNLEAQEGVYVEWIIVRVHAIGPPEEVDKYSKGIEKNKAGRKV
jgi:hypothetical protein